MITQEIKAKLTILAAAIGLLVLTGCTTVPAQENITHRLSTDVNFKSTDSILDDLDKAERYIHEGEVFTLVITSPGGLVLAYKTVLDRFNRSELLIRTKVHTYAASAGAMMFLLGDERIAREDAKILFHYARYILDGQAITADVLTKYLNGDVLSEAMVKAIQLLGGNVEGILERLNKLNISLRELVVAAVGEEITNKLLIAGKDVTITGKEALDMGVATATYKLQTVKKRSFIPLKMTKSTLKKGKHANG